METRALAFLAFLAVRTQEVKQTAPQISMKKTRHGRMQHRVHFIGKGEGAWERNINLSESVTSGDFTAVSQVTVLFFFLRLISIIIIF